MDFTPLPFKCILEVSKIVTVHYFEYARDFAFTGERHDFWEMAYIDKGEVGVIAEDKGYTLKQGEAIFHKPFEYHNIWANKTFANVVIITFVCDSELINLLKNKMVIFDNHDKEILSRILKEAEHSIKEPLNIVDLTKMTWSETAPLGSSQLLKLYIEELLLNLIRKGQMVVSSERISLSTKERNKKKIVDEIKKYLEENTLASVTLDDVCSKFCFSKTYIKSLFKEVTGGSIMQHFISLKLDVARKFISEGNLTFSEIAEKCGFSSVHYFSRTFKKHTGMTPTEYALSIKSKGIL